jgi:hypothetical protein
MSWSGLDRVTEQSPTSDWKSFDDYWASEERHPERSYAYWHLYQTDALTVARKPWMRTNYYTYSGIDTTSTELQGIFYLGRNAPDFLRDHNLFSTNTPVTYEAVVMSPKSRLAATWRRHHARIENVHVSLYRDYNVK